MTTDNDHARATYSVSSSDEAPAMLLNEITVNGVSLNPIDPMRGFYDRMVAKGESLNILRNLARVTLGDLFDEEKYKEHCITCGYGSKEAMDIVFPGQAQRPEGE